MQSRLVLILALLCVAHALKAENEAAERFQVYGGYDLLSNSLNGIPGARHTLNGFEGSIAFPAWRSLRFKIDVSAYRGTNLGAQQHPYFITGGGQYSRRVGGETVYVEGLAGDGGVNRYWGPNQATGETASFVTQLGGGLDTPFSRRFKLRLGADYQYSYFALQGPAPYVVPYRIPGLPTNFVRFTSGVVWKF